MSEQPSRGGEEQGPHAAVGPEGTESWPCSASEDQERSVALS